MIAAALLPFVITGLINTIFISRLVIIVIVVMTQFYVLQDRGSPINIVSAGNTISRNNSTIMVGSNYFVIQYLIISDNSSSSFPSPIDCDDLKLCLT